MQKILVIGCPGSGKSTFARALSEITGIPVIHLDMLNWNSDKTTVPPEEFYARLNHALSLETWIIDGNYASTLQLRLEYCDSVFLLDVPTETCLEGLQSRLNTVRPDMPWVETEFDPEFVEFVSGFREEVLPDMLETLRRYPGKQIITLHGRTEMQDCLRSIKEDASI